jgi:hypothetical protein
VLANVLGNNFPVLGVGVSENVLDEVVSVLVTRDVNQRNARAVETTLTDTVKIPTEEINASDLKTLLNDLGCKLIHAVLRSIADDVVNGPATISRSTMLADVLDTPVAELAMSNDINASQYLFNARTLEMI